MPAEQIRRGTCQYCGCTEERSCPEDCWWIDAQETVCSATPCVGRFFAAQAANVRRILHVVRRLNEQQLDEQQFGEQ